MRSSNCRANVHERRKVTYTSQYTVGWLTLGTKLNLPRKKENSRGPRARNLESAEPAICFPRAFSRNHGAAAAAAGAIFTAIDCDIIGHYGGNGTDREWDAVVLCAYSTVGLTRRFCGRESLSGT